MNALREVRRCGALPLALVLLACSSNATSVRLVARSPGDEIYRISCKKEIGHCREEAARACNGSYEVLESSGAPIEPPRVTSAPGPTSTGPRYQRPKWVGQMVVACGAAPAAEGSPLESAPPAPAATTVQPAPDRVCIPGITRECLGPAACRGAQACLPDGNGYGPCDCGEPHATSRGGDAGAPRAEPR